MTPLTPPGYPLDVCCLCCHELNEGGALNGHLPMSGDFFDLLPQEDDEVGITAEDTKDILTLLTKEHKMDLDNTKVVLVEKVHGKMRVVAVIENAGVTRSVAPLQAQNIIVPKCENACNPANTGIMCTEVDSYFACGHLQCKQTCMAIGGCIVCSCKDFVKDYSFCSDFYLPGHGGDDKPEPYVSPSNSQKI